MCSDNRKLSYGHAINEALRISLAKDPKMLLIGQGVKSPWYVGSTCNHLVSEFGEERVIDTPVSENAMTGLAVGAAIAGNRSVVVHPRMDFMFYAFDPIVNEASNWHYMTGGRVNVPVVFWGIINRGGEQGAQHSQAIHSTFAHFPGLKVVMPATPYDAKGLMRAAIMDDNPVVFIDDRWLYSQTEVVPTDDYQVEIGKAHILKPGKDLTIVSVSYGTYLAQKAGLELEKMGINVELVDLRSVKPYDKKTILNSVRKTGKILVVDIGWQSFGVASEIISMVAIEGYDYLKMAPRKLALEDVPTPSSVSLEKKLYFDEKNIFSIVKEMMNK